MRKIELSLYADFIFRNELPEEIMIAMHENAEVRQSEDGIIICAFTEEKKAFEFHHICANHGFICEFHETEDNGNVTEVKWVNINKQLPPEPDGIYEKQYLVTVICDSWEEPKTMVMRWQAKEVRNKLIKRWTWQDRIVPSAWKVTHWAEFPSPVREVQ